MTEWQPTPAERLILAEKWPNGERVRYDQLKPGDIFRSISPDGEYINPCTFEPSECVNIAREMPQRLSEDIQAEGYCLNSGVEGYCLYVDTFESLEVALAVMAN